MRWFISITYYVVFLFITVALRSECLHAQEPIVVSVKSNGIESTVNIAAGSTSSQVILKSTHQGNQSTVVQYSLQLPRGAKVTVNGTPASSAALNQFEQLLIANNQSSSRVREDLPPTLAATAECDEKVAAQFISILNILYPQQRWDTASACEWLLANTSIPQSTPTPPSPSTTPIPPSVVTPQGNSLSTSYVSGSVLLKKNACGKKTDTYPIEVVVDLSGIDPPVKQQGFTITSSFKAAPYSGCKAATVKPTSDGKYAPQPLLLMCSLGWNQSLSLDQWSGTKLRRSTPIKILDFVYYRGKSLTRSTVGKYLRGGKGSFTLASPSAAYNVCFSLTRSRQRANGYTN